MARPLGRAGGILRAGPPASNYATLYREEPQWNKRRRVPSRAVALDSLCQVAAPERQAAWSLAPMIWLLDEPGLEGETPNARSASTSSSAKMKVFTERMPM